MTLSKCLGINFSSCEQEEGTKLLLLMGLSHITTTESVLKLCPWDTLVNRLRLIFDTTRNSSNAVLISRKGFNIYVLQTQIIHILTFGLKCNLNIFILLILWFVLVLTFSTSYFFLLHCYSPVVKKNMYMIQKMQQMQHLLGKMKFK